MKLARTLLATACALVILASSFALSRAQACEDISIYRQGAGPVEGDAIPVVIHIMERPAHPCEVRKNWTSAQVAQVFGPAASDQRSVNSAWAASNIRFRIRDIELHAFNPPAGMLDSVPGGPRGSPKFETGFKKLVAKFHRTGSVNLYLWDLIPGAPMGFGRSPRSGNGKATVWLDQACVSSNLMTLENCARNAAHELGHALGLYHAGASCEGVQLQFRQLCKTLVAPCGESKNKERLMAEEVIGGRKLCPAEAAEARNMATQLK